MNNAKLLIIGHKRHGKDTVCEILESNHGFKFVSSSDFVGQKAIWPLMKPFYPDYETMFRDRVNHRPLWFNLVSAYCASEPDRTAREMLEDGYDIYCGMRSRREFVAAKEHFDYVVWVDRSKHLEPESSDSMELEAEDSDYIIYNNGSFQELQAEVREFIRFVENDESQQ